MIAISKRLAGLWPHGVCLLLALLVASTPARAADPATFVDQLASKAIPVLTDSSLPKAEREAQFRRLMHEGFDVRQIAQLVTGRYWRQASEEQKQNLVKLLEDYLVQLYSARFTEYANVSLQVNGSRPEAEGTLVHSTLVRPNAPPVSLDWRVEEADGRHIITDLVVEGVSMVITQRSEFASVIRQGGGQVQALIDVLRRKVGA